MVFLKICLFRGLCLPSDTNMKDEDLNVVVNKIKEIYADLDYKIYKDFINN